VSREGKEESIPAEANDYGDIKISPDGSRVALSIGTGGNEDIWIWDLVRETTTRLTFDEAIVAFPIWTPDGNKIIYSSTRALGKESVYCKSADGTGENEELVSSPDQGLNPMSLSGDGKILVLSETAASNRNMNIGMISMEGDRKRGSLLNDEKYHEFYPQVSPDGRWMAYMSNESGKDEVYVRPFPEVDRGKWQVSANGGDSPLWSPDGRELFYRSGNSFMAVDVETEPTFKPGKPRVMFKGNYYFKTVPRNFVLWNISPDGKRFLMIKPETAASPESAAAAPRKINIVLNWFEELEDRVPVER
jgi:serine/threonine-protein kinase